MGYWPWGWCSSTGRNRVLNFAQGQLGVVAAVFLVKCFYDFGFNYWFALGLAFALASPSGRSANCCCAASSTGPRS